jgi:hypothetical protein
MVACLHADQERLRGQDASATGNRRWAACNGMDDIQNRQMKMTEGEFSLPTT